MGRWSEEEELIKRFKGSGEGLMSVQAELKKHMKESQNQGSISPVNNDGKQVQAEGLRHQ